MKILTLDQLDDALYDVTFAPTRIVPVIFCLVFLPLLLLDVASAFIELPVPRLVLQILWISTPMLLGGAGIGCAALYAAMRSTFWLCRIRANTMWVRCSNQPDSLVVELDRSDLTWAQPLRILSVFDGGRTREYTPFWYLELGLTESAAAFLDAFVHDERISKTARETIAPPAKILNMPARLVRPGVLRLCWSSMSPGLKQAGKTLSKWVEVRPMRHERDE